MDTRNPDAAESRTRVLIADDNARVRQILRAGLIRAGFQVVAEADSAESAASRFADVQPDLCLLDVRMPGGGGLEAAVRIRDKHSRAGMVMLSTSDDPSDVLAAARAGADGYVLKGEPMDDVVQALRTVQAGETAFSPRFVRWLLNELRLQPGRQVRLSGRKTVELTGREWEIMRLLSYGQSTASIAHKLFLSSGTVRVHITNVVRKLGVSDRDEAVAALGGAKPA